MPPSEHPSISPQSAWHLAEDGPLAEAPCPCSGSQQPVPEQLRIQVSRVSMHDYEALHYDKEQLREACEWHWGKGAGLGVGRAARCPRAGPVTGILSSSCAPGHRGGPRRQ